MAADIATARCARLGRRRYSLLGVITFVVLFPVYTTVIGALKPAGKLLEHPLVARLVHARGVPRRVDRRAPRPLPRQLVRRRVDRHRRARP